MLCIETTGDICSVCLHIDGKMIALKQANKANTHATHLTLLIEQLFAGTSHTLPSIEAVVLSSGPGSYTGMRIGASVAKGLCYALDKPLIAVNTLEALAGCARSLYTQNQSPPLLPPLYIPMSDARRMEAYLGIYDEHLNCQVAVAPFILQSNSFAQYKKDHLLVFCGSAVPKAMQILGNDEQYVFLDPQVCTVSASNLYTIAQQKSKDEQYENLANFEPNYLKIMGKPIGNE